MIPNYQHCRRIAHYFRTPRFAPIVCGHVVVMSILMAVLLSNALGQQHSQASAQMACASGDTPYTVVSGDSLSSIAQQYQTSWQELARHNKLTNADLIFASQVICLPGKNSASQTGTLDSSSHTVYSTTAAVGYSNPYPYAQCTWWADQRYQELHGVYVPWTTNSNAWQWPARAQQYGWHVSSKPKNGAIIALQPWTQGAYELGHVAVVEQVLSDSLVLASNMNWAGHGDQVINVQFHTGPGVSFITN